MLRIKYTMGIAALLLLQASSSFAAGRDHQIIPSPTGESTVIVQSASDEMYRTAASKIQGQGDQLAATDAALQADQAERAPNAMTMEYPALALLAMAIISIAALSRRDSLRIDR